MSSVLNRIAFEQSRELEFFDEKELNLQIGTARGSWALAILKELVDNALDACEKAPTGIGKTGESAQAGPERQRHRLDIGNRKGRRGGQSRG